MKKDNKIEGNGVIYILTNPSFNDYVKIGYAKDIEKRLKQFNRSEMIPYAFRAYAVYETPTALTDKELHRLIDIINPDLRTIETFDGKKRTKEFYAMSPENAYALLECIAKISGTEDRLRKLDPTGHEVLDEETAAEIKETTRRGPFTFSACRIPIGAKISYVNDPSIIATVVDDKHVEYEGETLSLTALAKKLLDTNHAIQGPLYFQYNGEILTDLRLRIEKIMGNSAG